jgi:hypothetical protein
VIPPNSNGEFVANTEDVLEIYSRPYDRHFPLVRMDEQSGQLFKETRVPATVTKKHPQRVDYGYERARTASFFCFASLSPAGAKSKSVPS